LKAVVIGGTGLTGFSLVQNLSKNHEVVVLSRRDYVFPHSVKQMLVNFDEDFDVPHCDHLFLCHGYPVELIDLVFFRKKNRLPFLKVDYEITKKIISKASEAEIRNISYISAVGANKKSLNFYLKTKGLIENSLAESNFESINIFRPSHLLGKRDKKMDFLTRIFELITNFSGLFLLGPFKKYKNIDANKLSLAMIKFSLLDNKGLKKLEFRDF
jgi:nucleoside-diphosphate-sugar epimerase